MSRNNKTRKRARKARKLREHEAQEKAAEDLRANPSPINFSRLHQVFASMSFHSRIQGGEALRRPRSGPTVKASTPEELAERTDEAHVEEALKETPS